MVDLSFFWEKTRPWIFKVDPSHKAKEVCLLRYRNQSTMTPAILKAVNINCVLPPLNLHHPSILATFSKQVYHFWRSTFFGTQWAIFLLCMNEFRGSPLALRGNELSFFLSLDGLRTMTVESLFVARITDVHRNQRMAGRALVMKFVA